MVLYKGVLKDWFKGTGGGSGLCTEFEGWNDEKLERFDVDLDTYDHTDIASRPAVLINGYCKQRIPYLTAIHLWDKVSDYLLSSRHDPVKIGRGEGGFDGTPDDFSSMSDSSPNAKRRARKSSKLKMANLQQMVLLQYLNLFLNHWIAKKMGIARILWVVM